MGRISVARHPSERNGARPLGLLSLLSAAAIVLLAPAVAEAAPGRAAEPDVQPNLPWLAGQLVPSPEWLIDDDGARFGARWQVTPLLYSFGIDPRLSPWRVLVAEPVVRYAGSIELYGSPTYLAGGGAVADRWILRAGLRAYFPLLHRGEYLACSIGSALLHHRDQAGASYEAGLYTLFGFLGLQAAFVPTRGLRSTSLTLNVRVF